MKPRALVALMGFAPIVTVPTTWHLDRERSAAMMSTNRGVSHFGSAPSTDVIEAYFPVEIGMGLVVSRFTTTALPDGRDGAIAAVVGELEKWGVEGIVEKTHDRKTTDKVLELVVGGKDARAQMAYTTRLIVAADATSVVAVLGQCFERDDANLAHITECRKALLTLDTGIALADRVAIAFPGGVETTDTMVGSAMKLTPAQLTDGSKINFAPITLPPPPADMDRRPIYVGLGVVVLAAALWWQRRQREKFDRNEGRQSDNDADDDELHDAAKPDEKGKDA